jgi:adenine-specific DNA methylase
MMVEKSMLDVRLIERWLPIAEIGIESLRERTPMTPFPAPNRLHVWWARRPLVASRAAVLASLLPADADHKAFLHVLGIHGDPMAARRRIAAADRKGERLGKDAYGYPRAFSYRATAGDLTSVGATARATVLDPTAGGGAIPFEAMRLGFRTIANDLNPVAATILGATVDMPQRLGMDLVDEFDAIGITFRSRIRTKFTHAFPDEPVPNTRPDCYLWARTISCPYCSGLVPLSPNWRLNGSGLGVRLKPHVAKGPGTARRICSFEIVDKVTEHSEGTVSDGDATCPFPDCARVIDGGEVKRQAQTEGMGEQLFAVVFKRRVETRLKSGKLGKPKWKRGYRAPLPEDDNAATILAKIAEKRPEWEAFDILPSENYDEMFSDRSKIYGVNYWSDLFNPRQLLGHALAVEIFREMVEEDRAAERLSTLRRAAYVYLSLSLSLSLDKLRDYNSRMTRWHANREVMVNTFDRHDFAFKWSYAEMAIMIDGLGYDWAIEQTGKCLRELVELSASAASREGPLFGAGLSRPASEVVISSKSGASLDHIPDGSVDAVVMDPPYGANVMYAELSDFFYVWLKRTAGLVAPELFTRRLTDKESEAVANPQLFSGRKGAAALATRDYQEKMAAIFAESRRVLKPNGIMTVMFTHKETSAWDALTKGLIEAGFIITASWPVNTEAEGSLHIKDKAAANSTIFLVCRPRPADQGDETTYWEDVEPLVTKAVRTRVEEFQKAGISGVDLYLASFGPALEEFSRHWPLKRGTPRPEPLAKKRRRQAELFEEEFDPYAVTPEDALDAARREVKTWRLNQLTHTKGRGDLDATTSWFVLAWDAFKAPVFSYDEGLRLARAVGADLDGQVIGKICEKKGSDVKLWDSVTRAAKNALGPADGSRAMIDAIHHAAYRGRTRTLEAALDLLKESGVENDPQFLAALEAVLEVLPPSRNFVGFDVAAGDAKSAADDFDALEKLRRLAFSDKVDEPQQLSLFVEEAA